MVAIVPLIGETFLESSRQSFSGAPLGLGESPGGTLEFLGMGDFLARREGNERQKAGINPYQTLSPMGNGLRIHIDEQTEIPTRGTLHQPGAFDLSHWQCLRMKTDDTKARHFDGVAFGAFERIRKWNTREFVAITFEFGLFGELLETSLPGCIGG